MANYIGAPLYKRDRKGGVRFWQLEVQDDKYRTISGLLDGAPSTTGWTTCTPKNVGKKNETSAFQQAEAEVKAEYDKKLDRGYFAKLGDIDNPVPIKPMLAHKYHEMVGKKHFQFHFEDPSIFWFAQPKLDGIRNIANKDGMFSRTGQPTTGAPHVFEELADWFDADLTLVLDGELYNHTLRDDFNTISSAVRKKNHDEASLARSRDLVQYHIYDVIIEDLSFADRQAILDEFFAEYTGSILVRVPTIRVVSQRQLDELESIWVADGYEGQMVRTNGEYENTRSWNLLKRKSFDDEEFPFIRAEEGNGNWAGYAKRIVVFDEKKPGDDKEQDCGMRGSQLFAQELLTNQDDIESCTVRYFGRTPDGVLRMPVVTDFHKRGGRQD
jgi:DNA ligase-1